MFGQTLEMENWTCHKHEYGQTTCKHALAICIHFSGGREEKNGLESNYFWNSETHRVSSIQKNVQMFVQIH